MMSGYMSAWAVAFTALAVLPSTTGCKRQVASPSALRQFDTPAWMGLEGSLAVKTFGEDGRVLLLRRRKPMAALSALLGTQPENPDPDSREVIYLYDPSRARSTLEVADLHAWADATAPEGSDFHQADSVPGKLYVSVFSNRLEYKGQKVPTKGPEIVHLAKCPGSGLVAILSARQDWTDLETLSGVGKVKLHKFYHQAYDLNTRKIVGTPIPLPLKPDDLEPKCVWAGGDQYVVYADALHTKVFIIHTEELMGQ